METICLQEHQVFVFFCALHHKMSLLDSEAAICVPSISFFLVLISSTTYSHGSVSRHTSGMVVFYMTTRNSGYFYKNIGMI